FQGLHSARFQGGAAVFDQERQDGSPGHAQGLGSEENPKALAGRSHERPRRGGVRKRELVHGPFSFLNWVSSFLFSSRKSAARFNRNFRTLFSRAVSAVHSRTMRS